MDNDSKAMTGKELTAAVSLLLEQEEARVEKARRRKRRRARLRREERQKSFLRMTQSIEVIKWCIIGIASVMAVALLVIVLVVWQIGNEAQRIKGEVEQIKSEAQTIVHQIEDEANKIRDKFQHPLKNLGGAIGERLEGKIEGALGIED